MKWLAALTASALLLCLVPPAEAQFQSVRVQVIDRGQADGMLIRTPNSQWVVIDAASLNHPNIGRALCSFQNGS